LPWRALITNQEWGSIAVIIKSKDATPFSYFIGNATKILNVEEALRYAKEHWHDYI
jgi:hypothetical protein